MWYGASPRPLLVTQVTATPPLATPTLCRADRQLAALAPHPITRLYLEETEMLRGEMTSNDE